METERVSPFFWGGGGVGGVILDVQRGPTVREPVLHTLFGVGFGDALCTVQLCLHGSHVETSLKTQSTLESK